MQTEKISIDFSSLEGHSVIFEFYPLIMMFETFFMHSRAHAADDGRLMIIFFVIFQLLNDSATMHITYTHVTLEMFQISNCIHLSVL
jgi:hypothetical protein